MEQAELNFYVNALQKKLNDYFSQSVVLESKIAYQNEIISKQNQLIEEQSRSIEEYKSQIAHFDAEKQAAKTTTPRKRKSATDGGEF